ncbi:MAG: alpha/beta fold hydrolase [Ktedonobacterales bacterium]
MAAAGLPWAHFVGHSMGGYISMQLAAERPEHVGRLVLVAPAAVPAARTLRGEVVPLLGALRAMRPDFLPILTYDALRAGPITLLRAARDLLVVDDHGEFGRIAVPTLLIWGANDTLVLPATGELLRRELPDARLLVLPRAGHVVMYDRPRAFDDAVLAFLAGEVVGI